MISRVPPDWSKWREPVDTAGDLPTTGECGEIRLVLDTKTLYVYNCDTNSWEQIGQVGIGSGTDKGAVYFEDGELKVSQYTIIDDSNARVITPNGAITQLYSLADIVSPFVVFHGDQSIAGNLAVQGSLSVGGTKNAAVLMVSAYDKGERVPTAALESPFMSGIYFVDTVRATPDGVLLEFPPEFRETTSLGTVKAFLTPKGKAITWYEPTDGGIIVYADPEVEVDVFVWARRWDVEAIEDMRKEAWRDEHGYR